MMRYEQIQRVQKVRVTYSRGVNIAEGTESKVYRVGTRRFPSGEKYILYGGKTQLLHCKENTGVVFMWNMFVMGERNIGKGKRRRCFGGDCKRYKIPESTGKKRMCL